MILNMEQNPDKTDIEINIIYPEKDKNIEKIVSFLNSIDAQIECYSKNGVKKVTVSDIYYVESIDKIAVVFCEKESFKTKYRLYQIYEELIDKGFVQISKYCLLNINKLEKIKPLLNNRMEAILTNGKILYINRNYRSAVKQKLQEGV